MEQAEKNNMETILDFDEWRNTDQATYFEFFQLNKLGDYLTKEQRQRILDIAKVMFPNAEKGLIRKKLHNVQKINRENAPGPYGQRTSSFPGTLVATAQACGMTVGHSAPAPGVNPAAKKQPGFLPHRWTWPVMPWLTSCTGKGCF